MEWQLLAPRRPALQLSARPPNWPAGPLGSQMCCTSPADWPAALPAALPACRSDLSTRRLVVKGGEDVRIDERVEQLFDVMNGLAAHDPGRV